MYKEPATIITAVIALITEVIGLLVAYGIDVSDSQEQAIVGTVTAASVVIFMAGPIIRQFVYSPKTVDQIRAGQNRA